MDIVEQLRSRTAKLLTVIQLSEILSLHPMTLYKACQEGTIPHIRVGGGIRFDAFNIAEYLDARKMFGSTPAKHGQVKRGPHPPDQALGGEEYRTMCSIYSRSAAGCSTGRSCNGD